SLAWKGNATVRQASASPAARPTLKILKAEYGAGDRWLDVTEIATRAVQEGRLRLRAGNALGADPAPGAGKTLRVAYSVDGAERIAEARENEELRIDPAPAQNRITLQPDTASGTLSFVCAFAPQALPKSLPDAEATFAASRKKWPVFW